jgi:hypothetical protein
MIVGLVSPCFRSTMIFSFLDGLLPAMELTPRRR